VPLVRCEGDGCEAKIVPRYSKTGGLCSTCAFRWRKLAEKAEAKAKATKQPTPPRRSRQGQRRDREAAGRLLMGRRTEMMHDKPLKFFLALTVVSAVLVLTGRAQAAPTCKPAGFPCPSWVTRGTFNGTFRDEFNGSVVGSAWQKGWFGEGITDPANSDEDACYDSANVTESGGVLRMALTVGQVTCPKVGTVPYRGSMANTRLSFNQRFGSFEARVCFPDGNGDGRLDNWPIFWLNGPDSIVWPDRGEIDIAEVGGDGLPDFHLHYRDTSGVAQSINFTSPQRLGCHNYGAKWTSSGTVTLYHDGVQMFSHAFNGPAPEFVIFSHSVDTPWGTPIVPGEMTVDWVRAWT
jgi:hypothetical protein